MQLTINLPDKFRYLGDNNQLQIEVKQKYALFLYREEKVSLSSAAELAGMNIYDFMHECKKNNIPVINYTPDDLDKELNNS